MTQCGLHSLNYLPCNPLEKFARPCLSRNDVSYLLNKKSGGQRSQGCSAIPMMPKHLAGAPSIL